MDEHVLELNISVHDVLLVNVVDGPDELQADSPYFLHRQGVVLLHVLQQ